MPGVVTALARYGFDVEEVWFGIGTEGMKSNPSAVLKKSLEINQDYAASVVSDPRGHVLHGRLAERDGRVEEKLVDVLLALQVARLAIEVKEARRPGRVIIVISEDMDLIPAYSFARELGVQVVVAANGAVDARPECPWILTTEQVLLEACGRPTGRYYGSDLRQQICKFVTEGLREFNFEVHAVDRLKREAYVHHNSGAQAVWRSPDVIRLARGDKTKLFVCGVEFEPGSDFPRLVVSKGAPTLPLQNIEVGTAIKWRTATRLEVALGGGLLRALTAPSGTVLPEQRVVVLVTQAAGGQQSWRYVGCLDPALGTPGFAVRGAPTLVRVVSSAPSPGALVRAIPVIPVPGTAEITLQPPPTEEARTGDEYAAVPIKHTSLPQGIHVTAVAVSSRLR